MFRALSRLARAPQARLSATRLRTQLLRTAKPRLRLCSPAVKPSRILQEGFLFLFLWHKLYRGDGSSLRSRGCRSAHRAAPPYGSKCYKYIGLLGQPNPPRHESFFRTWSSLSFGGNQNGTSFGGSENGARTTTAALRLHGSRTYHR